jgi:hypothetical protein
MLFEHGQLIGQCALERRPSFGPGNQCREIGEFADDVGMAKLAKDRDDHQVANGEAILKPLLFTKRV